MTHDTGAILRSSGLRDTQQRRDVLSVLSAAKKPLSHGDIHERMSRHKRAVNLVTVYRMLRAFQERGLVHRHPSSGDYLLCSLPGKPGHHGMLSCNSCGKVVEFADESLCVLENRIARSSGFVPAHHVSEIIGTCSSCR